jgi:trehalose-6-phosphate synthase
MQVYTLDVKNKGYEEDYEETVAALNAAIVRRDRLDDEISSLDERVKALETLIGKDYPYKGRLVLDQNMSPASADVNVAKPQITERVKGILTAANGPLTSGEIVEELKHFGWNVAPKDNPKSNPWALIHGICRRLVDQRFAREAGKDGRKAWIRAD